MSSSLTRKEKLSNLRKKHEAQKTSFTTQFNASRKAIPVRLASPGKENPVVRPDPITSVEKPSTLTPSSEPPTNLAEKSAPPEESLKKVTPSSTILQDNKTLRERNPFLVVKNAEPKQKAPPDPLPETSVEKDTEFGKIWRSIQNKTRRLFSQPESNPSAKSKPSDSGETLWGRFNKTRKNLFSETPKTVADLKSQFEKGLKFISNMGTTEPEPIPENVSYLLRKLKKTVNEGTMMMVFQAETVAKEVFEQLLKDSNSFISTDELKQLLGPDTVKTSPVHPGIVMRNLQAILITLASTNPAEFNSSFPPDKDEKKNMFLGFERELDTIITMIDESKLAIAKKKLEEIIAFFERIFRNKMVSNPAVRVEASGIFEDMGILIERVMRSDRPDITLQPITYNSKSLRGRDPFKLIPNRILQILQVFLEAKFFEPENVRLKQRRDEILQSLLDEIDLTPVEEARAVVRPTTKRARPENVVPRQVPLQVPRQVPRLLPLQVPRQVPRLLPLQDPPQKPLQSPPQGPETPTPNVVPPIDDGVERERIVSVKDHLLADIEYLKETALGTYDTKKKDGDEKRKFLKNKEVSLEILRQIIQALGDAELNIPIPVPGDEEIYKGIKGAVANANKAKQFFVESLKRSKTIQEFVAEQIQEIRRVLAETLINIDGQLAKETVIKMNAIREAEALARFREELQQSEQLISLAIQKLQDKIQETPENQEKVVRCFQAMSHTLSPENVGDREKTLADGMEGFEEEVRLFNSGKSIISYFYQNEKFRAETKVSAQRFKVELERLIAQLVAPIKKEGVLPVTSATPPTSSETESDEAQWGKLIAAQARGAEDQIAQLEAQEALSKLSAKNTIKRNLTLNFKQRQEKKKQQFVETAQLPLQDFLEQHKEKGTAPYLTGVYFGLQKRA
jgi:hypothetical protein